MLLGFHLIALPGLKFKSLIISFYQILTILIPLRYKGVLHASGTNQLSSTVSYN
jgi:hypothetical protein